MARKTAWQLKRIEAEERAARERLCELRRVETVKAIFEGRALLQARGEWRLVTSLTAEDWAVTHTLGREKDIFDQRSFACTLSDIVCVPSAAEAASFLQRARVTA